MSSVKFDSKREELSGVVVPFLTLKNYDDVIQTTNDCGFILSNIYVFRNKFGLFVFWLFFLCFCFWAHLLLFAIIICFHIIHSISRSQQWHTNEHFSVNLRRIYTFAKHSTTQRDIQRRIRRYRKFKREKKHMAKHKQIHMLSCSMYAYTVTHTHTHATMNSRVSSSSKSSIHGRIQNH